MRGERVEARKRRGKKASVLTGARVKEQAVGRTCGEYAGRDDRISTVAQRGWRRNCRHFDRALATGRCANAFVVCDAGLLSSKESLKIAPKRAILAGKVWW